MDKAFFSSFYLAKEHKQLIFERPDFAYIQYKEFRIDLLSGQKTPQNVFELHEELNQFDVSMEFEQACVVHLFYEYGFISTGQEELIDPNKPLAIFIRYEEAKKESIYQYEIDEDLKFEPLSLKKFKQYHEKFNKVYHHLLHGDCYQLNLTIPFYLRATHRISPENYIDLLWRDAFKVGAYAHATYIDVLGKLFLSNSPECLFQILQKNEKSFIRTMPIKGTIAVEEESQRDQKWNELTRSKKDEAELFMISDLMKNDLTKTTMNSAEVLHKKSPLHVPGLIHQFSVLESEVEETKKIGDIVLNLFPGGSITGAPKKNVMRLTKEIEKYSRGFYCGSTLLLYKNLKTASINIRSAEVDYIQNEVKYGAGGGITLLSQPREEYEEALGKLKSFLLLLN